MIFRLCWTGSDGFYFRRSFPNEAVCTGAEAASLRRQLFVVVVTPSMFAESRLFSFGEESEATNDMLGKFCGELQTGRDQTDYNRLGAGDQ